MYKREGATLVKGYKGKLPPWSDKVYQVVERRGNSAYSLRRYNTETHRARGLAKTYNIVMLKRYTGSKEDADRYNIGAGAEPDREEPYHEPEPDLYVRYDPQPRPPPLDDRRFRSAGRSHRINYDTRLANAAIDAVQPVLRAF